MCAHLLILFAISSSVVAGNVSGGDGVGGLVGGGISPWILSCLVVGGEITGDENLGGVVGYGAGATVLSSSVVADELRGGSSIGGLVGVPNLLFFYVGRIAYSYVVLGRTNAGPLVRRGGGTLVDIVASYWDSNTSDIDNDYYGEAKTSSELRMPTDYEGVYANWDDGANIGGTGIDNITIYCDRDNNLNIEADEQDPSNHIWDFGTANDYPAIRCTPITSMEWRSWWFLNGTGHPQLNQTRLDSLLAFWN